jgi:hypothetical protein
LTGGHIAEHAGATIAVVENELHLETFLGIRDRLLPMKLKRRVVYQRYAAEIESLYG